MKLRIIHEPWDQDLPYTVEEEYADGQINALYGMPGQGFYFRIRCKTEEAARTWADAYMRGPTVVTELSSEAPSESPTARP